MPNPLVIIVALMGFQGSFFLVGSFVVRRDAPLGSRGYKRVTQNLIKYRLLRSEALADERLMRDFVRARRQAHSSLLLGYGLGSCLACVLALLVAHRMRVTLDSPSGAFTAIMILPEILAVSGSVVAIMWFVRRAEKQPGNPVALAGVLPRSYGVRWTLAVSFFCVFIYAFVAFGVITGQIPAQDPLPGDVNIHTHPLVAWICPVAALLVVALCEGAGLWLRRQSPIRLNMDPAGAVATGMYEHASEQFMRLEALSIYGGEALMLVFLWFAQTTILPDLGVVTQVIAIVTFLCSGLIIALVRANLRVR